jgi:hypothetical protein
MGAMSPRIPSHIRRNEKLCWVPALTLSGQPPVRAACQLHYAPVELRWPGLGKFRPTRAGLASRTTASLPELPPAPARIPHLGVPSKPPWLQLAGKTRAPLSRSGSSANGGRSNRPPGSRYALNRRSAPISANTLSASELHRMRRASELQLGRACPLTLSCVPFRPPRGRCELD